MAWESTQQTTLADALVVEHSALEELDDIYDLVDWARINVLLKDIHNKRQGEKE